MYSRLHDLALAAAPTAPAAAAAAAAAAARISRAAVPLGLRPVVVKFSLDKQSAPELEYVIWHCAVATGGLSSSAVSQPVRVRAVREQGARRGARMPGVDVVAGDLCDCHTFERGLWRRARVRRGCAVRGAASATR